MINVGIIGLGTIFATQYQTLCKLSKHYKLCAVYDTDYGKAIASVADTTLNIHESFASFLQDNSFQVAIIMTPPGTHTELARQCLLAHKHVLLEKPATLSMADLEELYSLSKERNLFFEVAYHASFAVDVAWYLQNKELIHEHYKLGRLWKIECGFYDPYMENGQIMPEKYALCGSFIDSAVNALSVCARLTALSDVELFSQKENRGFPLPAYPNGITYSAETEYRGNDISIILHTAWDKNLNLKTTELFFENSDSSIMLHHSSQSVILRTPNGEQTLFEESVNERLHNHYMGVYTHFAQDYNAFVANPEMNMPNEQMTADIHRLLLG